MVVIRIGRIVVLMGECVMIAMIVVSHIVVSFVICMIIIAIVRIVASIIV